MAVDPQQMLMAQALAAQPMGKPSVDPVDLYLENHDMSSGNRPDDLPWNPQAVPPNRAMGMLGVPSAVLQHLAGDVLPMPAPARPQTAGPTPNSIPYALGQQSAPNVSSIGGGKLQDWFLTNRQRLENMPK